MTPIATKTPRARKDLVEIAAYIGQFNEDAAYRFLIAAARDFNTLSEFPGLGAPRASQSEIRGFTNPGRSADFKTI